MDAKIQYDPTRGAYRYVGNGRYRSADGRFRAITAADVRRDAPERHLVARREAKRSQLIRIATGRNLATVYRTLYGADGGAVRHHPTPAQKRAAHRIQLWNA